MVQVNSQNTVGRISINSLNNAVSVSVADNVNTENIVDIGNLYSQGNGIIVQKRIISVNPEIVAFKSDLTDFLISNDIAGKADKATTLSGYGILDGVTYELLTEAEND